MQEDALIVEDVLPLDDEHGVPAGSGTLHRIVAGAVLAELAPPGRIQPEEERAGTGARRSSRWATAHASARNEPRRPPDSGNLRSSGGKGNHPAA